MSEITQNVLSKIDELQIRYIAALDSRDMGAWLATFSDNAEASYTVNTAESVEAELPMALIMDDNRARLEDRVTIVTKIWTGVFADYRPRHFVQRTACKKLSENLFEVTSNFMLARTPSETGRAELETTGVYIDQVDLTGGTAKFLSKTVITDAAYVERFTAYPL